MDSLQRLEAFESALSALQAEYEDVCLKMEHLRQDGKIKTATYQQLTARKLALQSTLGFFEARGLTAISQSPQ